MHAAKEEEVGDHEEAEEHRRRRAPHLVCGPPPACESKRISVAQKALSPPDTMDNISPAVTRGSQCAGSSVGGMRCGGGEGDGDGDADAPKSDISDGGCAIRRMPTRLRRHRAALLA